MKKKIERYPEYDEYEYADENDLVIQLCRTKFLRHVKSKYPDGFDVFSLLMQGNSVGATDVFRLEAKQKHSHFLGEEKIHLIGKHAEKVNASIQQYAEVFQKYQSERCLINDRCMPDEEKQRLFEPILNEFQRCIVVDLDKRLSKLLFYVFNLLFSSEIDISDEDLSSPAICDNKNADKLEYDANMEKIQWNGVWYQLNGSQNDIISRLYENWKSHPDIPISKYHAMGNEVSKRTIKDIFSVGREKKPHRLYGTLVKSPRRGYWMLDPYHKFSHV